MKNGSKECVLQIHPVVTDPPIAKPFSNVNWSWLWFTARLYIGYTWLSSGLGKINNPAWVSTGEASKGSGLVPSPSLKLPPRQRSPLTGTEVFIEGLLNSGSYTWFSKVVVAGELLVGIALILGAFTGIAAFFGAFMNWNFMMAGTASVNPLMLVITILIILAWKTAGWWGLDRWLLPSLGTPWRPGGVFGKRQKGSLQAIRPIILNGISQPGQFTAGFFYLFDRPTMVGAFNISIQVFSAMVLCLCATRTPRFSCLKKNLPTALVVKPGFIRCCWLVFLLLGLRSAAGSAGILLG